MVRYECIDEEDDARDSIVQESELPQKDYKIKVNTDSGIPNYIVSFSYFFLHFILSQSKTYETLLHLYSKWRFKIFIAIE